jgi:hypothetical protein
MDAGHGREVGEREVNKQPINRQATRGVVMELRLCLVILCVSVITPVFAQNSNQTSSFGIDAVHMPEPKLTAFEKELLDTQKALLDAMKRGDTAYVSNAIANDFMVITANGDPGSKGELVEAAVPAKDQKEKPQPIFYDFKIVQLSDNAGVVTYNVVFPSHIERYQHLSDTWVKEGNQWKLKFQQTTLNLWSAHDL